MEYNDEAMPSLQDFEEMAKAYSFSLREKGFVFINVEQEGKNLLVGEVFDLLFRLRSSYRYLGTFFDAKKMLSLTEEHIDTLRKMFGYEGNKGFMLVTNRTKCFLNAISLENSLLTKLLILSQKCDFGHEILSMLITRSTTLSENLSVDNVFQKSRY